MYGRAMKDMASFFASVVGTMFARTDMVKFFGWEI